MAVHHRGGHTSFYNSKALEMAGIHKDTPNPPGGTFDRDPNGELNGRVTDRATGALSRTAKRSKTTGLQEICALRRTTMSAGIQAIMATQVGAAGPAIEGDAVRGGDAGGQARHHVVR